MSTVTVRLLDPPLFGDTTTVTAEVDGVELARVTVDNRAIRSGEADAVVRLVTRLLTDTLTGPGSG